ncbi:hypothetical protein HDU67_003618 [Dinochytrium kinnereticum]|nr:hypothetical protein HDU67_003618 [Dinochytrium kinnereticum]
MEAECMESDDGVYEVSAIFHRFLELEKTASKLDRLRQMVFESDPAKESWKLTDGVGMEDVRNHVQASDAEIEEEINRLGLFLNQDRLVPISDEFLVNFIRGTSAVIEENDLTADKIRVCDLLDGLSDLFDDVPRDEPLTVEMFMAKWELSVPGSFKPSIECLKV